MKHIHQHILHITLTLMLFTTTAHIQSMEAVANTTRITETDLLDTPQARSVLLAELYKIHQEVIGQKEHHAQLVIHTKNKWDRKVALACFAASGLIVLKTAMDVIAPQHMTLPSKVLVAIDGLFLTGTTLASAFHLIRSCCRKAKIE